MKTQHDWSHADALTDEQIYAAALADPDVQPVTPERLAQMKQTPRVKIIRRSLGLTQAEFAVRFQMVGRFTQRWGSKRWDRTTIRESAFDRQRMSRSRPHPDRYTLATSSRRTGPNRNTPPSPRR